MPSALLTLLKTRLTYLKSTLPAFPATSVGSTPSQFEIDTVSFCAVMAGAACESFIEEMSLKLAESAMRKFTTSSTMGRVGKHLCVFPFVEVKDMADIRKMVALYGATGFDIRVSKKLFASSQQDIGKLLHIG